MVYYLYNACKYRSLTFFSACNPAISFGGMLDDHKTETYSIIPEKYLPKSITYDTGLELSIQLSQNDIQLPVIVKPNMGYKGYAVRECDSIIELEHYLNSLDENKEWLIQEYIDLSNEYSVMYYRLPVTHDYGVTSFSDKQYPLVRGDGVNTLNALIDKYDNAFLDKKYIKERWKSNLNKIPKISEEIELHHIGNYSRGSKFHSLMNENDEALSEAMNNVLNNKDEIYFCRFDIKAESIDEVRNGNFKVMEINGAKSEPLHIYDSNYRFWDRIIEVQKHWKLMTKVVDERRSLGYKFPGNREGLKSVKAVKRGVK